MEKMISMITKGADTDDKAFIAFLKVLEEEMPLPADGFVIGEPVSVTALDYDGNVRRGLTAWCRRGNGAEYLVGLIEIVFPETVTFYHYKNRQICSLIQLTDTPSSFSFQQ